MIYVVLGCHKSGTTLVAEVLHRSGIAMVEGEVGETDYDRGDFFERPDWVFLNQDILGFGNPVSDFPAPTCIRTTDAQSGDIDQKIEECEKQHESWGFKDPRTCLTYPIWKEHLPAHSVIGVYRPLAEFWAHETRVGWRPSLWKTIRTWCEYNRRLAEALERRKSLGEPYLLISYGKLMADDDEFERLERFVGRKLTDRRNANRYRSRPRGRWTLRIADHILHQLGYPQPSVIAARLESLEGGEVLSDTR